MSLALSSTPAGFSLTEAVQHRVSVVPLKTATVLTETVHIPKHASAGTKARSQGIAQFMLDSVANPVHKPSPVNPVSNPMNPQRYAAAQPIHRCRNFVSRRALNQAFA